jgi:predicted XRE-type DNA-binding protein
MELMRIANKIIDKQKIYDIIDEMLQLRQSGLSQTEVANRLGIDRTVVSRLETLGEVRKGKSIAVIGFPILNKEELVKALGQAGVDFIYLLTEQERWNLVKDNSGLDLFNTITDMITKVHTYDQVIVIGSNRRIKMVEATLDKKVIGLQLGQSPIKEDCYIDAPSVVEVVRAIKSRR